MTLLRYGYAWDILKPLPKFLASAEPNARYYHRMVEKTYEHDGSGTVVRQAKCNGLYANRGHLMTDDSADFAAAGWKRDPCPKCFGLPRPEPEGLVNGTDIVWARNADIPAKASRSLALMLAQGMLVAWPGDRVIDTMLWRAMPRWFAKDYGVAPVYDNPEDYRG